MPEFVGKRVTNARFLNKGQIEKWQSFSLHDTLVDDDGISALEGRANNVTEVVVSKSLISDASMRVLCSLPSLRTLQLEDVPLVTDEGIKHVGTVANLRELALVGTELTDDGVDAFCSKEELRMLDLSGTRVTDFGLRKLHSLQKLSALNLKNTAITAEGLAGFNPIRYLYLDRCAFNDEGVVKLLTEQSRIVCLWLNHTKVTDLSVHALSQLNDIGDLAFDGCNITDEGVESLVGHPSLVRLYLQKTGVSSGMVDKLKNSSRHRLSVFT